MYDSGMYRLKEPAGAKWLIFWVESQTVYETELPPCGEGWETGSAVVLTHFAERNAFQTSFEPDRITFCQWFIDNVVEQDSLGVIWDTI